MDKTNDFNNFSPYSQFYPGYEDESMFNPMIQYEQGYVYYRYLSQQLDYKIKCKEYEKLCNLSTKSERRVD